MKNLRLVLFLLIVPSIINAQDTLPRNWSVGYGFALYTINSTITNIDKFAQHYPSLGLSSIDFTNWGKDEKITTGEAFFIPTAVGIEFGWPMFKNKSSFFKLIELRTAFNMGTSSSYTDNHEQIIGENTIGNTISRQLYCVEGSSNIFGLHIISVLHTPHLGKHKLFRFGIGAGVSGALISSNFNSYYVNGVYIVTKSEPTFHSFSRYPAKDLSHEWQEIGSSKIQSLAFGYSIPISVEFRFDKSLPFHIGMQYYLGQYFINGNVKMVVNSVYPSAILRFDY